MPRRYYSSTAARTTLASGVNDSTTSFTVVAVSGWPSSFPYTLIIDQDTINEEVVNVTARTGTSLTVERGQDGTTAVSHSAGASVNHGVSARDFNEPNQFLNEGGTVTGQTVVSSSGSGTTLEVRNTGTGNSFVVEDSANPDSTPFVIDASGRVGIGTSSPSTASPDASLDVYRSTESNLLVRGDANTQVLVRRSSTDGSGANLNIDKARGTDASKSVVSSGDTIGRIHFRGYDGSAFQSAADIFVSVDGTPGASDMPGSMIFRTTPDGSATLSERMRIDQAGNVGIGTTSPGATVHAQQTTATTDLFRGDLIASATNSSILRLRHARGTPGAETVVSSGDGIGAVVFAAYDGSAYRNAAYIEANVDGTPGASDMPGRLAFYTTADGSASSTERMRIDNAGLITGTGTSLGAWTAYTPAVAGTGWDLGNGTVVGRYCQIGKVVCFYAQITFGSTSTFGTGQLTVSLPTTHSSDNLGFVDGLYFDTSVGDIYRAFGQISGAGTVANLYTNASPVLTVINTRPFTWANTDIVRITGVYHRN